MACKNENLQLEMQARALEEEADEADRVAAEEKAATKEALAPLAAAARSLAASPIPSPPKALATLAAWGSIVALGFGLWRWWRSRKKRAS